MAMKKPSNPAVGDLPLRNRSGETLQHASGEWQDVSSASFYVFDKLLLLLWVEYDLVLCLGAMIALRTSVPPR